MIWNASSSHIIIWCYNFPSKQCFNCIVQILIHFHSHSKHFLVFLLIPSLIHVCLEVCYLISKYLGILSNFSFSLKLKPSVLQDYFIEGIIDSFLGVLKLLIKCLCFKLKTKGVAGSTSGYSGCNFSFWPRKLLKSE